MVINDSLIWILMITAICSMLLAFISACLTLNTKCGIDRIFTSIPHLLLVNITAIILISDSKQDLISSLFSIPLGTLNCVIFIFVYCLLSSWLINLNNHQFLKQLSIILVSFALWLILSFIWAQLIQHYITKQPHIILFNVHFSSIIIFGILCAFIQFILGCIVILLYTNNTSEFYKHSVIKFGLKTYVIRAIFAVIISTFCIWILITNKYAILCGIICVFPSLQLSFNQKPFTETIIIFLLESSSSNIFALLVARFYLISNIGIVASLVGSYCIIITTFIIPIHCCMQNITGNSKPVRSELNHVAVIPMYGSIHNPSRYSSTNVTRTSSLGDL